MTKCRSSMAGSRPLYICTRCAFLQLTCLSFFSYYFKACLYEIILVLLPHPPRLQLHHKTCLIALLQLLSHYAVTGVWVYPHTVILVSITQAPKLEPESSRNSVSRCKWRNEWMILDPRERRGNAVTWVDTG